MTQDGCYSTLAPLAVRGKIILGYSAAEVGVRGSVRHSTHSPEKRLWKTYTVPGPGAGGETWKGETYKTRRRIDLDYRGL